MTTTPKLLPVTGHGAARITDSNNAAKTGEVRRTSDIKNVLVRLEGKGLHSKCDPSKMQRGESIDVGGS